MSYGLMLLHVSVGSTVGGGLGERAFEMTVGPNTVGLFKVLIPC